MVDANELLDALRDKLRSIPALLAQMALEERIAVYRDYYPGAVNLLQAINLMPAPGMLIVYDGNTRAMGRRELWQHNFRIAIRCQNQNPDDGGYGAIITALANGVPEGSPVAMFFSEIHPACYAMGGFDSRRQQILIDGFTMTVLEYFELTFNLKEKGA